MDIPTESELLAAIDAFLRRHGMAATRFGAEATGEPQLLSSVRGGRSPSLKVWRRVADYMARKDSELAKGDHADLGMMATSAPSHGNASQFSDGGAA